MLSSILEHRGDECLRGIIMTVDRGYAHPNMLQEMANYGVACVGIMPEHLVKCHPFVGLSSMKSHNFVEDISYSDKHVLNGEEEHGTLGSVELDRRRDFVIGDRPTMGLACFRAKKPSAPGERRKGNEMHAMRSKLENMATRNRPDYFASCISSGLPCKTV